MSGPEAPSHSQLTLAVGGVAETRHGHRRHPQVATPSRSSKTLPGVAAALSAPGAGSIEPRRQDSTPKPTTASPTTTWTEVARKPLVDVLDRRRHRVVCERPALPESGTGAAKGCGAHRGADQLFLVQLPRAARRPAVRGHDGDRRLPVEPEPSARARRPAGAAHRRQPHPAAQSRLPDRRVGLDVRPAQAAAGQGVAGDAGAEPHRQGSRRDRRLRRQHRPGPAVDVRRRHADDSRRAAPARGRRIHQRRRRACCSPTRWRRTISSRAASTA